jgi:hypothetical protein
MFDSPLCKPSKITAFLPSKRDLRISALVFFTTCVAFTCMIFTPSVTKAQPSTSEFNSGNCAITNEAVPTAATSAHFSSGYRLRITPQTRAHKWEGVVSAVRVRGACQSHVTWGYGDQIGLDSGQYINFNKTYETTDFRPSDFDHSARFRDFSAAPRLFGQVPVYFADLRGKSIGVWRSSTNWTVNSISKSPQSAKPQITRLATSNRRIISALTSVQYHSPDYDLGIVQEQSDGSIIVFTFRFVQR